MENFNILEHIVDSLNYEIIVFRKESTDNDYSIIYGNNVFYNKIGKKKKDICNVNINKIFEIEYVSYLVNKLNSVILSNQNIIVTLNGINIRFEYFDKTTIIVTKKILDSLKILTNQQVFVNMFNKLGYMNVDYMDTSKQIINTLVHTTYDILLFDIDLSTMDSFECIKAIRKIYSDTNKTNRSIPYIVVAISPNNKKDKDRCYRHKIDGYIVKPNIQDELEIMLNIIEEKRII
jgi:CheY-like chemotaxis protein